MPDHRPHVPGPDDKGRHATRSIIWSSWSQMVVAVCGLVWLFTVPRVLGANLYGVYILLSSLIDFHTLACTLGIHNAFAYYYPRYQVPGREREMARLGVGVQASVIGRFWSLDREENWDRIEKTYRWLVEGQGRPVKIVAP